MRSAERPHLHRVEDSDGGVQEFQVTEDEPVARLGASRHFHDLLEEDREEEVDVHEKRQREKNRNNAEHEENLQQRKVSVRWLRKAATILNFL